MLRVPLVASVLQGEMSINLFAPDVGIVPRSMRGDWKHYISACVHLPSNIVFLNGLYVSTAGLMQNQTKLKERMYLSFSMVKLFEDFLAR